MDALDQPLTRWHELRKVLDATSISIAVMNERQKGSEVQWNRIEGAVGAVHNRLDKLADRTGELEKKFEVLEREFSPVKSAVYAVVGLICLSVVAALVALVIINRG